MALIQNDPSCLRYSSIIQQTLSIINRNTSIVIGMLGDDTNKEMILICRRSRKCCSYFFNAFKISWISPYSLVIRPSVEKAQRRPMGLWSLGPIMRDSGTSRRSPCRNPTGPGDFSNIEIYSDMNIIYTTWPRRRKRVVLYHPLKTV